MRVIKLHRCAQEMARDDVPGVSVQMLHGCAKGAITSKIKHWTVCRHWLQVKTKCQGGLQQLCKSCRTCFKFYCMFSYPVPDRSGTEYCFRSISLFISFLLCLFVSLLARL